VRIRRNIEDMLRALFIAQLVAVYVQISQSLSDYKFVKENRLNYTSTNSYAQAINYGQTHPTRDGESWSGWYGMIALFPPSHCGKKNYDLLRLILGVHP
jgi:hypothetical protein